MNPPDERQLLMAVFAALADPERARALPDQPALLAVARRHRLTPLLAITCGRDLPPGLAATCRRDHVITAARNLALASVAEECVGALADAGIEAALLKGMAYERSLYAAVGARPTSDVDLLIRDPQRRRAFEVLDALGFEPRAAAPGFDDADYHEVAWRRDHVEVDLHMALAPTARGSIDHAGVWERMRPVALGARHAFMLGATDAAVFHALHMAIDHFDVPGLYLLDLSRLLPAPADVEAAASTARAWRCHRPLATALALAAAFQPAWDAAAPLAPCPARTARVIARFGPLAPLSRPEQLRRKLTHFDTLRDAVRYTAVQTRRNLGELVEKRLRRRTARARLGLGITSKKS